MREVYICGARRTAIGSYGGVFRDIPGPDLAMAATSAALSAAGVPPERVDEVIIGVILTAGQGMGPARQVAVGAGIPLETPAYAINMLCGSGMKAVMVGADRIRLGKAEVVVAGGMENMSRAPYLAPAAMRFGTRMGDLHLRDHMTLDALTDVFRDYHMGVTAENIAERYRISREEQDEFALTSQQRAVAAIDGGRLAAEITPVRVSRRGGDVEIATDEHPRRDVTPEKLAALRPAFRDGGSVTAGNSSGLNDGASVTVLASADAVKQLQLTPMARIVADGQAGVDPAYMGLGPVPAVGRALAEARLDLAAIDLIELNEAFAAQSLGVITELAAAHRETPGSIRERCNVNGGAIALGHPVGASGNRIIVTLLHEMARREARYGLATLCIGGGMGTAMILERP
jgi:acetyl-CoA C-acetyltransferase